jgi:V-type H+-transporting ATPase subunit B
MTPSVDQPRMSAQEAAAINAAAVTRNYAVKPRMLYQTVAAVSGSFLNPTPSGFLANNNTGPLIVLDNVKVYPLIPMQC